MLRHQLPVYSPVSLGALGGALADVVGRADPQAELARGLGRRFAAEAAQLFGSGTQALQRAIELSCRSAGPDAVVALPAFACFDVASAAVGARSAVVLYDVDPGTLSPDLTSLERACIAGARVVVVAHLFGIPVDWAGIAAVVAPHGVALVEDAAQGLGATFQGRPLGSLGPVSVLSFGRGKGWTGGAGGALLFRAGGPAPTAAAPPPSARLATSAGSYARTCLQWLLGRPSLYGLPVAIPGLALGETRYHPPVPPCAMPAIAAAVALRVEQSADAHAALRRAAGAAWAAEVAGIPGVSLATVPPGAQAGYLRFPLRLARRDSLADRAAALGVVPSYPAPLSELPQLAPLRREAERRDFPGAQELAGHLLTLPTHAWLRAGERAAILAALRAAAA